MSIPVSRNLTRKEVSCPCCGKCNIDPRVFDLFQDLRHALGDKPIIVLSAYRCVQHNRKVGGAPISLHTLGLAIDIFPSKSSLKDAYAAALLISKLGGLGAYADSTGRYFLHLDLGRPNRRWFQFDGKDCMKEEFWEKVEGGNS